MNALLYVAELLGPTVVAILTVPAFGYIKKAAAWVDSLPPWLQQISVVIIAAGLSALGSALNTLLPGSLSFFTETDVSALLSAAMAFGIHAGRKRIEA